MASCANKHSYCDMQTPPYGTNKKKTPDENRHWGILTHESVLQNEVPTMGKTRPPKPLADKLNKVRESANGGADQVNKGTNKWTTNRMA